MGMNNTLRLENTSPKLKRMEPKEEAEIRVKMDKEKEREGCSSFSLSVLFSAFYPNPTPKPI